MEQLPDAPEARSGCRRVLPKMRLMPRTVVAVKHSRVRTRKMVSQTREMPKHTSDLLQLWVPLGTHQKQQQKAIPDPYTAWQGCSPPARAVLWCGMQIFCKGCSGCVWYLKCHVVVISLGWLRDVTVVSQGVLGCAVAAQSAADAQGCVAASPEHSSPQQVPSPLGSCLFSLFKQPEVGTLRQS